MDIVIHEGLRSQMRNGHDYEVLTAIKPGLEQAAICTIRDLKTGVKKVYPGRNVLADIKRLKLLKGSLLR